MRDYRGDGACSIRHVGCVMTNVINSVCSLLRLRKCFVTRCCMVSGAYLLDEELHLFPCVGTGADDYLLEVAAIEAKQATHV
jgi:hypothetical protein